MMCDVMDLASRYLFFTLSNASKTIRSDRIHVLCLRIMNRLQVEFEYVYCLENFFTISAVVILLENANIIKEKFKLINNLHYVAKYYRNMVGLWWWFEVLSVINAMTDWHMLAVYTHTYRLDIELEDVKWLQLFFSVLWCIECDSCDKCFAYNSKVRFHIKLCHWLYNSYDVNC